MGIRIGVIGGGIIGLAVARELVGRRPGADVVLFEKEDQVAAHQTGRNSGVVHAGLYYEPGGLKAQLCRRGIGLLKDFAADKGVSYQECGKIVVAKDETERHRLKAILDRAAANGVPDVSLIGPEEITRIEPSATGVAALHSPHTAIVDFTGITEALASDVTSAGAEVRLSTEVIGMDETPGNSADRSGVQVRSRISDSEQGEEYAETFDLVIACGGLQSDRLARMVGESVYPKIVPFYGDYFMLAPDQADRVRGLIYPAPDPRYPFLGVHITRRYDGEVMLGPNAFLALGREAYRRTGISFRDLREVAAAPGFWRFAANNIPAAVRETRTALSKRAFVNEANQYMPGIAPKDVTRGPRGVRAQAMNADGSLVDDFVITGSDKVVLVRNAPSPGATSALAIAEHITNEALSRHSRA